MLILGFQVGRIWSPGAQKRAFGARREGLALRGVPPMRSNLFSGLIGS